MNCFAAQAGAGAASWQELVVKLCRIPAAPDFILLLALLIAGFAKRRWVCK